MAKSMQLNIGGGMRKVKSMYINIGGVLRKVKKGFVNIGGVLKEFFGGGVERVVITIDPLKSLPQNNYNVTLGGAEAGTYAVFSALTTLKKTFTAYSNTFVRSAIGIDEGRPSVNAASTGDYAVFVGGYYYNGDGSSSTTPKRLDAIDKNLTITTKSYVVDYAMERNTAISNNGTAFFAGGTHPNGSWDQPWYTVLYVDNNLVYNTSSLASSKTGVGGASVGSKALYVAGEHTSSNGKTTEYSDVECFTNSGTKTTLAASTLSGVVRGDCSNQKYAVFFQTGKYEAYDSNLVRTTGTQTDFVSTMLNMGEYILSVGSETSKTARTLDTNLIFGSAPDASANGRPYAACHAGQYGLFAGKRRSSDVDGTVDVYLAS